MAKKTSSKKIGSTLRKAPSNAPLVPTSSKNKTLINSSAEPLLFGKQNYILMLGGILVMTLGFLLMLGGEMPDANTWDEDIIYGFRRTVMAPFMILAGLVILTFAIFKKQSTNYTD
ncbi:MAG: hypothetical protein ACI8VT_001577 [Saprospiraceae bacterium]|jgi:hypothetical protein